MTKIKAVLDQETWVAVDVPDEFQAIVFSLSSGDALLSDLASSDPDTGTVEAGFPASQEHIGENDSGQTVDRDKQAKPVPSAGSNQETNAASATSKRNSDTHTNEHGRASSQTLVYRGVGYHMGNAGGDIARAATVGPGVGDKLYLVIMVLSKVRNLVPYWHIDQLSVRYVSSYTERVAYRIECFESYHPVWVVHTGLPVDRYMDCPLLGGTIDFWGCFRPVTTRNRSVMVDFNRR
ncbi:hypothetical protein BHM03_00009220 [Ensete ventricosum]|nr:hypothetical protein BHM03_00009220 [Ensete ventricosum]